MELPKNIVQIGTPDKRYRVFVEDYVASYIKEVNRGLFGGQAGLAFYGKKYIEGEVQYYFIYGAAEVFGLEGRGQYLSEKEREQIEIKRLEFFEELDFLAWVTLGGETPEGFYLLEQGKGIRINGYATFFEKNENMLNFMLIMGKREKRHTPPEESFGRLAEGGNIDHRIMERSQKLSELRKNGTVGRDVIPVKGRDKYERNGSWKTVVAGMVITLCVIGIAAVSEEEDMKTFEAITQAIKDGMGEQKLPDMGEEIKENIEVVNAETKETTDGFEETDVDESMPIETLSTDILEEETHPTETLPAESEIPSGNETENEQTEGEESVVSSEIVTDKTVTYIVKKGDALLSICRDHYGSEARLQEICELNQIDNPDDIKVGQTILLPE